MALERIDRDQFIDRVSADGLVEDTLRAIRLDRGLGETEELSLQVSDVVAFVAVVCAQRAFPRNVADWTDQRAMINTLLSDIEGLADG